MLTNQFILNDKIDGLKHGDLNDYFWGMKAGFSFYFGK